MVDIALVAGAAIVAAVVLAAAAYKRRPETDWRRVTRRHLPHPNLKEEEINKVYDRDDFEKAVVTSEVRHYSGKRVVNRALKGRYTKNELLDDITEDVNKRAGDILLPQERKKVVNTSYNKILGEWNRARKRRR
ncbi:MAG: hypothetical protein ACE5J7_03735 [Candidatus Aenigmatarchaeota archaeon]